MPIVGKRRVIGNYGSNLVAHLLSGFCLVRPVTEGTDIGVDLYCETVEKEKPFLHFWVQVKSGKQIRTLKDGRVKCVFKADHLRYWLRQPVPVYAFYVPCLYPIEKRPVEVYYGNISRQLLNVNKISSKTKSIYADGTISLRSSKWHIAFVEHLKATTAFLDIKNGSLRSLPELDPKYIQSYSGFDGVSKWSKQAYKAIRMTACVLTQDASMLKHTGSNQFAKKKVQPLVSVLNAFLDINHRRPEILISLSYWEGIVEKNIKKAKDLCKEARDVINNAGDLTDEQKNKWLRREVAPLNKILKQMANNE